MDPAGRLQVAAWAFGAATVFGSAVAIRDDVPGEPLGIRLPIPVPVGLLVGWGAGVAAPWPMPAAAIVLSRRAAAGNPAGIACAALGVLCIAGTLVEPVTNRRRPWTRGIGAAIAANTLVSISLVLAGLRCARPPGA